MAESSYQRIDELVARRPVSPGFTALPNWLIDHPDVGKVDLVVYMSLARHANADGECWPSHRLIMAEARIGDKRTLWRALERLAAVGAVAVEVGDGVANRYKLLDRGLATDSGN